MSHFLNSPVFTGNPQAPTASTPDNSTTIATTAWVKNQGYGAGGGTVNAVAVTTQNGVSASVSGTTTQTLAFTLGAITPTTVNGLTFVAAATGFTVAGGTTSKTLTVNRTITLSAADDTSTLTIPAGGGTLGSNAFTSTAYEATANKSTTTSLGTSDTLFPTQNAVKTYVDNAVTGLLDDRGSFNASSNTWPSTGGSGTAGAILKGDLWYISVAGTLGGTAVKIGDSIRALVDTPGSTATNWDILNVGLGFTPAAQNQTMYLGTTALTINGGTGTQTTLAGMTSITSTSFTGTASLATAIAAGTANQVLYQSGAGVTAFATAGNYGVLTTGATGVPVVTAGAAGVLVGSASAIPAWSTTPTLTGTNFSAIPGSAINSAVTTATNLAAGTTNQMPYQTGAGATSFYSSANYGVQISGATGVPQTIAGAAGVLVGSASAIPAWSTTPTLTGTNFTGIPWSALPTTGAKARTITAAAKTAAYPVTTADEIILCDATSGAFAVTLTASPVAGETYTIKKIDSSVNAITVAGNGKNIDGAANQTLPAQWNAITVVYNGTAWYII